MSQPPQLLQRPSHGMLRDPNAGKEEENERVRLPMPA